MMSEAAIADAIHAAIVERRLPAGARLVEEQLAGVFGVSRARIRSVLQGLAREKVVTVHRNRGAAVSTPTVAEAREVFQSRRLLEDAIVRHAATALDAAGLDALRAHVERERAARAADDRRAQIALSGEFHVLLAEVGGTPTLAAFLRELVLRSSLIIAVYERPGAPGCPPEEHQRLIDLLAARDADGVAREMAEHLGSVEERLTLVEPTPSTVDLKAIFAP